LVLIAISFALIAMVRTSTIVCALDYSEGSEAALVRAADLSERLHAQLHLLHAQPIFQAEYGSAPQPEEPEEVALDRLRTFAAQALGGEDALDELGPTLAIRQGEHAADIIVAYASEVEADLLVIGTHGRRGVRHLIVGSVAEETVRRAPCPVLTVPNAARRTAPSPSASVLVPIDFSDSSRAALAHAKEFAVRFDAPVELVHVLGDAGPYPNFYSEGGLMPVEEMVVLAQQAETYLRHFDEEAGGDPATQFYVRTGAPHREISALAEENDYGLIVMATHGLTGLKHALLGSVTERTLRRVPCPLLSIRSWASANSS
jgi:nucleotide-binding universal stress UspA family protein